MANERSNSRLQLLPVVDWEQSSTAAVCSRPKMKRRIFVKGGAAVRHVDLVTEVGPAVGPQRVKTRLAICVSALSCVASFLAVILPRAGGSDDAMGPVWRPASTTGAGCKRGGAWVRMWWQRRVPRRLWQSRGSSTRGVRHASFAKRVCCRPPPLSVDWPRQCACDARSRVRGSSAKRRPRERVVPRVGAASGVTHMGVGW